VHPRKKSSTNKKEKGGKNGQPPDEKQREKETRCTFKLLKFAQNRYRQDEKVRKELVESLFFLFLERKEHADV